MITKRVNMKRITLTATVVSMLCLGAWSGTAAEATREAPKSNPFNGVLASVPPAELPAKAAQLVKKAKAREWANTTAAVVRSALEMNPAAAANVVSAIARAVPEMAALAAGTAAEAQPKQAVAIAKAAAVAARSKADKVAVEVSRAVPNNYRAIAIAVVEAVPASGRAVLEALAAAFPELKLGIEKGLVDYTGSMPPMGIILDQAAATAVVASGGTGAGPATLPQGPMTGPPMVVPPVVQGNPIGVGNTVPVPAGFKRNYATP